MKKSTGTFKDNIRRMFIVYSIVPTFVVACFGLLIFLLVWQYTIVHYNQEDNQYISERITEVVQAYGEQLDQIAEQMNLEKSLTAEEKASVCYDIYQISKETGCRGTLYLLSREGEVLVSSGAKAPDFLTKPEYQNWGILGRLKKEDSSVIVSIEQNGKTLCIGRNLYHGSKRTGAAIVTIANEAAAALTSNISRQYMVTNRKGWTFIHNYRTMLDDMGRVRGELQQHNGFISYGTHQYYMTCTPVLQDALYVYTVTDAETRSNMICLIVAVVLLIFSAIGLVTYFSTGKMADKNTQDIEKIAYAFRQMEKGDFNTYLDIGSSEEFEAIGKAYNLMLDSLKKQIADNQEMTEHVAFAQVKQLESQFNPHFLFNTLDNIRFMTKIDASQADKMIIALSKLLRYSISDAREEITVAEDMENMQNYLTILKIRFNKRFTYEIDIEDPVQKCLIPKLMVQPLIENAVKYGFIGRENLHVNIRGYEKHDKLIFICRDDGAGMNQELLKEIRDNLKNSQNATSHMGLYNIHRRIQLLYREDYGVKIQSETEQGTTVVLVLPIHKQNMT